MRGAGPAAAAIALIGGLVYPGSVEARWTTECGVAYQRANFTWSHPYDVECDFMFGDELNDETGSFAYLPFQVYVVVWWGAGRPSVIEATMLFAIDQGVDGEFTAAEAQSALSYIGAFQGTQRSRGRLRRWRVSVRRTLLGDWSTF